MSLLFNKVAIITGASSGIGYATAKLFALEGAKVVLAARRTAELERLAAEIAEHGGKVKFLAGDVKDELYSKALVELAVKDFGGLDIAFNNAGTLGQLGIPTSELPVSEWENTLATNLTGAFLGAKYQLPAMLQRGAGSMIFTSSFVGHTAGFPQTAAYASSKAGMIGLMQTLATEFGAKGIRVNALLPGATDTDMAKAFANTPEIEAFIKNLYALKRTASPDEIAKSALYLASDLSSFTTGTAMLVDGGVSICRT